MLSVDHLAPLLLQQIYGSIQIIPFVQLLCIIWKIITFAIKPLNSVIF